MEVRLNKFLAERLGLSRRQADIAISSGKVQINGKTAEIGARVTEKDEVICDGKPIKNEKKYTYLAFYKPYGYVCSRKSQGDAETIYAILPEKYAGLKTVGRLDKNTSGLIVLTDDGDMAFQMTHPKFLKHKKYLTVLDRPLEPLHQQMIADFGINLDDGKSQLGLTKYEEDYKILEKESKIEDIAERQAWFIDMTEGRNRQIRRTFAALGYRVEFLKRLEFGNIKLADLKEGEFREITLN